MFETNYYPQVIFARSSTFATAVAVTLRLTSSCGVEKQKPADMSFKIKQSPVSYADSLKV